MEKITKTTSLENEIYERDKKIFAELDDLIVELQSAPITLIEMVIVATRKILNQKC